MYLVVTRSYPPEVGGMQNLMWGLSRELSKNFIVEKDINQILDKINQEGFDSLTEEEQERLYKGSQSLSKGRKKD